MFAVPRAAMWSLNSTRASTSNIRSILVNQRYHDASDTTNKAVRPPMIGASLRDGIDSSTSPCDDFDQYINGGWRARTPIVQSKGGGVFLNVFSDTYTRTEQRLYHLLDSASSVASTTKDPLLRAVGTYYASCLAAETLERVRTRKTGSSGGDSTRAQQCQRRILANARLIVSQAFAASLFAGNTLQHMQTLVKSVHAAAIARVDHNPWMSSTEKAIATDRLQRLQFRVGLPKVLIDYSKLVLSPTEYQANTVAIANYESNALVTSIGGDVRDQWEMDLLLPNALYSDRTHAIEVPAVMFMPPFFNTKEDDVMNFAGIGTVVAHEIFHGVAGQLPTIEHAEMQTNIARLKALYSEMRTVDGWTPNGERTFSEDVADAGAVRVAYDAWRSTVKSPRRSQNTKARDGFTAEQTFFVALARIWRAKWVSMGGDVHSPPPARINGMVMTMPEFATAFGCKQGDPMVPQNPSRIW